jgi:hypothetical protein
MKMSNKQSSAFFGHWYYILDLASQAKTRAVQSEAANPEVISPGDALSAILFSPHRNACNDSVPSLLADLRQRRSHGRDLLSLKNLNIGLARIWYVYRCSVKRQRLFCDRLGRGITRLPTNAAKVSGQDEDSRETLRCQGDPNILVGRERPATSG